MNENYIIYYYMKIQFIVTFIALYCTSSETQITHTTLAVTLSAVAFQVMEK